MKHTPGPWSVQLPADDSSRIRVVDKRVMKFANHRIADIQYWTTSQERGPSRDEAIANAILIAAVPDLLVELENCADVLATCFPNAPLDSCIGVAIIKANTAIKNATGEQE